MIELSGFKQLNNNSSSNKKKKKKCEVSLYLLNYLTHHTFLSMFSHEHKRYVQKQQKTEGKPPVIDIQQSYGHNSLRCFR
jgi:hypothetical protein